MVSLTMCKQSNVNKASLSHIESVITIQVFPLQIDLKLCRLHCFKRNVRRFEIWRARKLKWSNQPFQCSTSFLLPNAKLFFLLNLKLFLFLQSMNIESLTETRIRHRQKQISVRTKTSKRRIDSTKSLPLSEAGNVEVKRIRFVKDAGTVDSLFKQTKTSCSWIFKTFSMHTRLIKAKATSTKLSELTKVCHFMQKLFKSSCWCKVLKFKHLRGRSFDSL